MQAYPTQPVRAIQELPAKKLTEPQPGMYVFDLGQNMVGWARLTVTGERGARVQMRFAEILDPDGSLHLSNLRSARQLDTYVLPRVGETNS